MTKTIIMLVDDGVTIKIHDVYTQPYLVPTGPMPASLIQLNVNGHTLTDLKMREYFKNLERIPREIIITDGLKKKIKVSPLPSVFDIMGGPAYQSMCQIGKEYVDYRASDQQKWKLQPPRFLGTKAFDRKWLKRLTDQQLAHRFVKLSEDFLFLGKYACELMDECEAFGEDIDTLIKKKELGLQKVCELGAEFTINIGNITAKNFGERAVYQKIYDSAAYARTFAAINVTVQEVLTWAAMWVGFGAVHPLVGTVISIVGTNYLQNTIDEYVRQAPSYLKDLWDKTNTCHAQPLSPLGHNILPVIPHSQIFRVLGNFDKPISIVLPASLNFLPQQNQNVAQARTPSFENKQETKDFTSIFKDGLYQRSLFPGLLQERLELFPWRTANQAKETDQVIFQNALKKHLEKQSEINKYLGLEIKYDHFNSTPQYSPGERGSVGLTYEGGKFNGYATADVFNAPGVAASLVALQLLNSYRQWRRLSPSAKAFISLRANLAKIQAAQENDWSDHRILFRRAAFQNYDEIENAYRKDLKRLTKRIVKDVNDYQTAEVFKALYYAVETNNKVLFTNPRSIDGDSLQTIINAKNVSFYYANKEFFNCLQQDDISGARKAFNRLKHHRYDAETHLAQAELCIRLGNFIAARSAIKNAEGYEKRKMDLAKNLSSKMVTDEDGNPIDMRAEAIRQAALIHHEVNMTKYHCYFQEANVNQAAKSENTAALQNLLAHTAVCLKENGDNSAYLNNHVSALCLAGQNKEAVSYLERLCKISNLASSYYRLGALQQTLGNEFAAQQAYEKGISLLQIGTDPLLSYYALCESRDYFFNEIVSLSKQVNESGIENEAIKVQIEGLVEKAFERANAAKRNQHASPIDGLCLGRIYLLKKDKVNAKKELEDFVNTKYDNPESEQKDQPFHSDAHYLLGAIYAEEDNIVKAEPHFLRSLELDKKNIEAMISYSHLLHRKRDFAKAEKLLADALIINPKNKAASEELQKMQQYRRECLTNLGWDIGFNLLNVAFNSFLQGRDVATRRRLIIAKQSFHLVGDAASNSYKHREFRLQPKNWSKLNTAGRVEYVVNKASLAFSITDQLLDEFECEMPQEARNTAHCIQIGADTYATTSLVQGYFVSPSPQRSSDDPSQVPTSTAHLVAFLAARGPDIVESFYRGGYRAIYGKYCPRFTNHAYLFGKDMLGAAGGAALIVIQNADAMYMLLEGAKTAAELALTYLPVPVTPDQLLIGAGIVVGVAIIGGVTYYFYNKSWHEKITNRRINAKEFSERSEYERAIKELKECFEFNLDEKLATEIKSQLTDISQRRLSAAIDQAKLKQKESGEQKEPNKDGLKDYIIAYEQHVKDVPEDEKSNKYLIELKFLDQYIKYTQQHKNEEAQKLCDERLMPNKQDVTALRCRAQLFLNIRKTRLARKDIDQLKEIVPDDPSVYQQLACAEQMDGNLWMAKKWLEKSRDLQQQNIAALSEELVKIKGQLKEDLTKITEAQEKLVKIKDQLEEELVKIEAQLESVNNALSTQRAHNIAFCFSGILSEIVDTFVTLSLMKDSYRRNMPFPYWTRYQPASQPFLPETAIELSESFFPPIDVVPELDVEQSCLVPVRVLESDMQTDKIAVDLDVEQSCVAPVEETDTFFKPLHEPESLLSVEESCVPLAQNVRFESKDVEAYSPFWSKVPETRSVDPLFNQATMNLSFNPVLRHKIF